MSDIISKGTKAISNEKFNSSFPPISSIRTGIKENG